MLENCTHEKKCLTEIITQAIRFGLLLVHQHLMIIQGAWFSAFLRLVQEEVLKHELTYPTLKTEIEKPLNQKT